MTFSQPGATGTTFENIPAELKTYDQWVRRDEKKRPINAHTGKLADITNPTMWASFKVAAASPFGIGPGFVFTANDPFFGIDLDNTHGDVEAFERQQNIFKMFNSYSELSPSGTGLHIICKGKLPGKGRRENFVEVYDRDRYFTMTGSTYLNVPIREAQELVEILYDEMGGTTQAKSPIEDQPQKDADDIIIARASAAKNGAKFKPLWEGDWEQFYRSQSEADFALINIISFYTDNREQVARIFRQSALGKRDKANRKDYIHYMVEKSFDRKLPPVEGRDDFDKKFQDQFSGGGADSANTQEPPPSDEPLRYHLLDAAAVAAMPPVKWAVHGILPVQGLGAIGGPSGSSKSFLALDLACARSEGKRWFGRRVRQGASVYVGLEGELGFRTRCAAWEAANNCSLPPQIRFVLGQPFGLTSLGDIRDLAAAILAKCGPEALIIVDTLNRSAPGIDENSAKDMGAVLTGAAELQRLTGGLVVLIHHTGKDVTKGLRGHSSLFAACDGVIECNRDGDDRAWRVAKSKDGADGEVFSFLLKPVELGEDEDGETVTSCVVVPTDTKPKTKTVLTGPNRIALDALSECRAEAIPPPQAVLDGLTKCNGVAMFPPFAVVPEALWRERAYAKGISHGSQHAKSTAFSRSRKALLDLELINTFADFYWLPIWCTPNFTDRANAARQQKN